MTEEENKRNQALEQMSYLDRLAILDPASKTPGISTQASEKLEELFKDYSTKFIPFGRDKPFTTAAEYDPQTREKLVENLKLSQRIAAASLRADSKTYKGLKTLEKMASDGVIMQYVDEKDRENAEYYASYLEYKKIGDEAKEGRLRFEGDKAEEKAKIVTGMIGSGIQAEIRAELEKSGEDRESANTVAAIEAHYRALKGLKEKGNLKYVEKGAKEQMEIMKKKIKLPDKVELQDYVVNYVGEAMERALMKSENHEIMEHIAGSFYEANKGYSIGKRKYSEAFPEKKDK